MSQDCELCKAQQENYRLVHETDFSFCVICKWPLKENHLLIMPKRHVSDLKELTSEEAKDLMQTIGLLKELLLQHYNEDPILHMNFGKHRTQEHLHFHLLTSKEGLRSLLSSSEGIEKHPQRTKEEITLFKDKIKQLLP